MSLTSRSRLLPSPRQLGPSLEKVAARQGWPQWGIQRASQLHRLDARNGARRDGDEGARAGHKGPGDSGY